MYIESTFQAHQKKMDHDNAESFAVDIQLVRGSSGLGFNINGGTDKPCLPDDPGIFVSKLRGTGAAIEDGRLQEGDKIIEINGSNIERVLHQQAVQLFLASPSTVQLKVIPRENFLRMKNNRKAAEHTRSGNLTLCVVGIGVLVIVGYVGYRYTKK